MKENLLVMICRLDETKVVLQCSNKPVKPLGIGGIAVENPDGYCTLLASSLHFVDRELHLQDKFTIFKFETTGLSLQNVDYSEHLDEDFFKFAIFL